MCAKEKPFNDPPSAAGDTMSVSRFISKCLETRDVKNYGEAKLQDI